MMPLGAAIGPAGLGVMPYTLTFTGNFFHVADFIDGLDSLVKTHERKGRRRRTAADRQRLLAGGGAEGGLPDPGGELLGHHLSDPAGQGLTAGASPESPAPTTEAAPASTTTGGAAQ